MSLKMRASQTAASATTEAEVATSAWSDGHDDQHPELSSICVIDCQKQARIIPNSMAFPLDNECFSGQVFVMIRTPDVDDKASPKPTGVVAQAISTYFKDKKRRFEFQFRVKLKKVPSGPLFLGCEVEHPIKVGRIAKGLSGVLLAMIRRINSGFHYSWGVDKNTTQEDVESGNYEKTHLSFPVEASMDRIVITKEGEMPPELGSELFETDASVKRRRKMGAGSVDWNTHDTYTMCLWSAYVDWIKWKSLNVAGVRPFAMGIVTGTQPIYLSVYEVKNISNADYKKKKPAHNRKDLLVYSRLELANLYKTEGGYARQIMDAHDVNIETDTQFSSESELFDQALLDDSQSSSIEDGVVKLDFSDD
jgi:Protein of unknown function (DUF1769)